MDIKILEVPEDRIWTDKKTLWMLSLYSQRKHKFRKNKMNKWVWAEIAKELRNHGMTNIDTVQLDQKFRNLKKTYEYIEKKQKLCGKPLEVKWRFYDVMVDLLRDEPDVVKEEDMEFPMESCSTGSPSPPQRARRGPQRKRIKVNRISPTKSSSQADELQSQTEEVSINTHEEALEHLRALQEYAMIHDNFRAIGLLTQAQKAIEYPPNSKDFDIE